MYLAAGTLWALVHAHISSCKKFRFSSWSEAKQSYKSIKEVTKLINKLYGRRPMVTMMVVILYYARAFGKATHWKKLIFKFAVAGSDVTVLVFIADITYQVCSNNFQNKTL